MTQQPRTPTTETLSARRQLLDVAWHRLNCDRRSTVPGPCDCGLVNLIAGIEREASDRHGADLLAQIEKAVRGVQAGTGTIVRDEQGRASDPAVAMRNAVLAAIRSAGPVEPPR